MHKPAIICPTVLARTPHAFREQMEHIAPFAHRIQIDLSDGVFALTPSVSLDHVWWPVGIKADIHLMYKHPEKYLDKIIKLEPHMLIVHAEADGDFDVLAGRLKAANIKAGVALLPDTPVSLIKNSLKIIDHVLIFSGNLGHFGGKADMSLLQKVADLKHLKAGIEIGWDGGVNDKNAKMLAEKGVDVLNVGGYIQNSGKPQEAYATLEETIKKN